MGKFSLFICFIVTLFCFVAGTNAQSVLRGISNEPQLQYSLLPDDSCSAGEKHDDGTFENSLAFNPGPTVAEFVIRMRPTSYPWTYNKLCWAMNTNNASSTMTMDVIVYDTTGAGGSPGAIVFQQNGINITGIPGTPAYKWFTQALTVPALTGGSYWVGVRYNPTTMPNRYYSFDAGVGVAWPSYYRTGGAGAWTVLDNTVLQYKCFAFRTEGSGGPPPATLYSRCKTVNLSIPDNNNTGVSDTFVVAGLPTTALITRVQIRMDSLIHTWVGDLRITVNKGATTVQLCRNPGAGVNGSNGNNFIRTTFSDSARYNIDSILNEATSQGYLSPPGFSGYFRTNSNPPQTAITSTPLSLFNGVGNPNGVYTFNWKDSALQDLGTVYRYCVMIDYVDYTGITQTGTEIPNKYFINQNYPNPFNPVTNIKFGLPNAGNVKLVVFDILGREVATLVNEFKAAGQYTADFDASILSSGVYFYRIESGDFIETKKMLLVK